MSPPLYMPQPVVKEAPEAAKEAREQATAQQRRVYVTPTHPPDEEAAPQEADQERSSPTRLSIKTIGTCVPHVDTIYPIGTQAAHTIPYTE